MFARFVTKSCYGKKKTWIVQLQLILFLKAVQFDILLIPLLGLITAPPIQLPFHLKNKF